MAVSVNEGGNTLDNFDTLLTGDMIRFTRFARTDVDITLSGTKVEELLVRATEFNNNPSPFIIE
jgi:hypothetical protein